MRHHNRRPVGCTALVAICCLAGALISLMSSAAGASTTRYRVVRRVRLGAPDRWDYVIYGASSDRVYIAHGNRLTVVDASSGRIVGQVAPIPGRPHGTAFDPAAGVGITDDGHYGQAVIFSLKTLKVLSRVKVQRGADAVAFDPVSRHAFVIDGSTGSIAVVDPLHRRLVTIIHIGGDLEYAVPGDNGKLYVNGVTHHEIFRINTATDRVDAAWPMAQCRDPHGLAIDLTTHRLFSSCENRHLVVVNANTGAVVAVMPIGPGTDAAVFDPVRKLVFSSNGLDGTLSVIREVDANTFVHVATVKTALSARTMSVDPRSGRVFLAAARTLPAASTVAAFESARAKGRHPFAHGSLALLFLDPVP